MNSTIDAMMRGCRRLPVTLLALLIGCAGTVTQDLRVQGDVSQLDGVSQVAVVMSPSAARQLAENPQFSREELANFLRRRLEGKGLIAPSAVHRVQIMLTDIRVRSGFAAIMLAALAGDDHVTGQVRVLDADGRPLRSFDVHATYSLGGPIGGQDSTRMNWLYDKFSELAASELEKVISPPRSPAGFGPTPVPRVGNMRSLPVPFIPAAPIPAPLGALDNADAVPVSERGRAAYRDWLTQPSPRAFIVSESGAWYAAWGVHPEDPNEPKDPAERALKRCREAGNRNCRPYAVDNRVLYSRPPSAATQ